VTGRMESFGPVEPGQRRVTSVQAQEVTAPSLPDLFGMLQTMAVEMPDLALHAIRFDEHDHAVVALVFYERGGQ
jgi:hypothetical protein